MGPPGRRRVEWRVEGEATIPEPWRPIEPARIPQEAVTGEDVIHTDFSDREFEEHGIAALKVRGGYRNTRGGPIIKSVEIDQRIQALGARRHIVQAVEA